MKKQLLTLSAFVDYTKKVYHSEPYLSITKHNDFLKQPLTFSDFIPCNSEGNPTKRPIKNRKDHSLNGHNQYTKALELYQTAKDAVIFEGFEIKKRDNPEWNYFGSSDYLMSGFHCESNIPNIYIASIIDHRDIRVIAKNLETRADLAEATQSNPLTLKTETK